MCYWLLIRNEEQTNERLMERYYRAKQDNKIKCLESNKIQCLGKLRYSAW